MLCNLFALVRSAFCFDDYILKQICGSIRSGEVVNILAFYSDDPSSNPAKAHSFSVKFVFEKKENKQKEAGVGPFLITISEGIEQRSNAQKRPKMVS